MCLVIYNERMRERERERERDREREREREREKAGGRKRERIWISRVFSLFKRFWILELEMDLLNVMLFIYVNIILIWSKNYLRFFKSFFSD